MTKYFEFHYSESQPEGELTFNDIEYPFQKNVINNVAFSSDTAWDNIILEFAKFLDNVGYVGVHDRVQGYINGYCESLLNKSQESNEDTSVGLSD